ncbi:MAG: succinate dehydrogenase cytochrome b subunit [Planctomycetota bacterium]|jgi:succinate dehydrogenase / fumarate reductase cytochrome b subunit
MSWLAHFYRSSIGSKVVMSVTGVLLLLFLIGHLAGNLLVYAGRDTINDYAEFLKHNPLLVWGARSGLLVVFLLHVVTSIRLSLANRAARPERYVYMDTVQASMASRYMLLSGALVLFYVVYHLLHFTLGVTDTELFHLEQRMPDGRVRHDVFAMVVKSFQNDLVVAVYVAANLLLAWHLSHGISSLFQSLGVRSARFTPIIETGGFWLAALIGAGYMSIPLSIRLGLITTQGGAG